MPVFSDGQKISETEWGRLIQSVPASYVVWKDGSTYRAECLLKGGTDYSGTDAATVIQSAIDALTDGGIIFIKAEVYDLTVGITIGSNVTIQGEGYSSVLRAVAEMDDLLKVLNSQNVIISNLRLDGNNYAHTLLGIYANADGVTENVYVEKLWMHDNKAGASKSILWVWDVAQRDPRGIKNVVLREVRGWNFDTGTDYDNIAFSFVDNLVVEDSYFEIEKTFIFYYTRHAVARRVYVEAEEYSTFTDDGNSNDTVLEDCISVGASARLYGSNVVIRGGYYYNGICFGESSADWYGEDITIEDAYVTGATPIQIYGERAIIKHCRLLTTFTHVVTVNWRSDIPRRPVFVSIEGCKIDNGGRSVYHIMLENAEKVVFKNNHLVGAGGWGIKLKEDPYVVINDNIFDCSNPIVFDDTWTGVLKIRNNKEYATENSGTATISSSTYVDVTHGLAGTPTTINVTPATSGTGDWYISNIGASTFRINVANSGTYTFHWTAEYKP